MTSAKCSTIAGVVLLLAIIPVTTSVGDKISSSLLNDQIKLTDDLWAACFSPDTYKTPFIQERLTWITVQRDAGKLLFLSDVNYLQTVGGVDMKGALSSAGYTSLSRESGSPYLPFIRVYLPSVWYYIRDWHKITDGFDQKSRNTFMISIVHETVHLERGQAFYLKTHTGQEWLEEEERTWRKVDINAVRPLRQAGQQLDDDYIESDDVLKVCNYRKKCPQFIQWLKDNGKVGALQ